MNSVHNNLILSLYLVAHCNDYPSFQEGQHVKIIYLITIVIHVPFLYSIHEAGGGVLLLHM
jgi:hypothetical protein